MHRKKEPMFVVNEIAEMKNCNKCILFESRRKTDLFEDDDGSEPKVNEVKGDELRTIFSTAVAFVKAYRGVRAADPECRLLKYWAHVEADLFKEMPEAR